MIGIIGKVPREFMCSCLGYIDTLTATAEYGDLAAEMQKHLLIREIEKILARKVVENWALQVINTHMKVTEDNALMIERFRVLCPGSDVEVNIPDMSKASPNILYELKLIDKGHFVLKPLGEVYLE